MRVTSGSAKGKKLKVPNIPGYRPPRDVYKQAVFGILGEKVINAICLDLYAGSGSFGIEALSRGANYCTFIDNNKSAVETIKENLESTGFSDKADVFQQDSVKHVANAQKGIDIIFADPFFIDTSHRFLFQNMEEILNTNGVIVFSHGKELNIEETIRNTKLKVFSQRNYGKAYATLLIKEK